MPESNLPTRRRWFRFSLRSLLVFMLSAGVLMGWIVNERRQSKLELEIGRQLSQQGWDVQYGGPFEEITLRGQATNQSWWRRWATPCLGGRVVGVVSRTTRDVTPLLDLQSLRFLRISNLQSQDLKQMAHLNQLHLLAIGSCRVGDITPLQGLTDLRTLCLNDPSITNLQPLAELQNLEDLQIGGTQVRDLMPIANLKKLSVLDIHGTAVTDLTPLSQLTMLRIVDVRTTPVPKEQVMMLQQALPKCKVHNDHGL